MASSVPTAALKSSSFLRSGLQFRRNSCRLRRNYTASFNLSSYKRLSTIVSNVSNNQCLGTTSLRCGSLLSPFSSSVVSRRAPNISEPGSLDESAASPIQEDPVKLAEGDLQNLFININNELQTQYKKLFQLSSYYFDGKGKAFRPVIIVLMSRALNTHIRGSDSLILPSQEKIAMVVEMIHTSSLAHDDVIDASEMRRGKPSINAVWGQRRAVLAGDYIISVAGQLIATLGSVPVVNTFSDVLHDLVSGEFMQLSTTANEDERFAHYLQKTYKKTASLMACGCKATAIMSGADETLQEIAFQYGRNVGIAFQLIDDLLDFVSTAAMLGKPATADLKLGLATAPVLFACSKFPELEEMIVRRFSLPGDCEKALNAVMKSDGLAQTRFLAEQHCAEAVKCVQQLVPSREQKALYAITDKVLNRRK